MAVIEGRRLDFNGPDLAVKLMEGQNAEIANIAPKGKYQLIYHFVFVLKCRGILWHIPFRPDTYN